jgi:hypothetical protein
MDINLRENLNLNIVLDSRTSAERGVIPAVEADIYFIYIDEPDSTPTYLATIAAGQSARVPFPETKRQIRLFAVPKSERGEQSTTDFAKVEYADFDFTKVNTTSGTVQLTVEQSGQTFINNGASGLVTYELPVDPSDDTELEYRFLVMSTAGIEVIPNTVFGLPRIRIGNASSTPGTGKASSSSVGNYLILRSIANAWIAETATGTWTLT